MIPFYAVLTMIVSLGTLIVMLIMAFVVVFQSYYLINTYVKHRKNSYVRDISLGTLIKLRTETRVPYFTVTSIDLETKEGGLTAANYNIKFFSDEDQD